MNDLYERIAGERRRLREVRKMMTAAVEQTASGSADYVPFYVAIGDYFETAMHRLHEQDLRLTDLLNKKADLSLPKNQQAMAELAARLEGNQRHLEKLMAARASLKQSGTAALPEFESAGKAYSDFIVANMGHHPGTNDMAQEVFSAEDWQHMAYVSDDDLANEQRLYDAVVAAKPAGLSVAD
jgi:phosphopantothenoylcysteine synthetase/decarboxylase